MGECTLKGYVGLSEVSTRRERGRSPYQIMFGIEPVRDLPSQAPHPSWIEQEAVYQLAAHAQQEKQKQARQEKGPEAHHIIQPGDLVTITAGEWPPLTHSRKSGYWVVSVWGKVALVQKLPAGKYDQPGGLQPVSIDRLCKTLVFVLG